MKFVIITGLSGAGRSCALKTFEDIGYYCADNIPPALIPEFAEICRASHKAGRNVAVVADMRMGDMFEKIYEAIDKLKSNSFDLNILFLDAADDVLVKRFKQTRRMHPVSGSGKILTGILTEREKLQRIKDMADVVLDTSLYTPRELATILGRRFDSNYDNRFHISVITFGYKRGIPMDADFVFDMRFLPNPFYYEELRAFSGLTKEVKEFLFQFEETEYFLKSLVEFVTRLMPSFMKQDKKQIVIGIGCTGGMHRSVAVGEELFSRMLANGLNVTIEHRDLILEQDSVKLRMQEERGEE